MMVLGISASPRLEGNSDLLLRRALAGARQAGASVEQVRLCDYRLDACTECYACATTGECRIHDDYPQLLDKMLAADRIVFATPVFFMTVSAQAKLLIDRGQCLWVRKTVLGKALFEPKRDRRGMIIAVGGSSGRRQFDCVRRPIQSYFKYLEVDHAGSLTVSRVDEKGAILRHPEVLDEAFRLGHELTGTAPLPQTPVEVEFFRNGQG
jgi:multimeric flavodoxin WrbA